MPSKPTLDAMHMAVMNQKVQKKAKGDLVEDLIKEAKSKQEAPPKVVSPVTKESQFEKDFRQYLANQQAAREQVATELPSRLVRGAIPGAAGAIAGYAAQIPGTAGDIASLYQELKPESWRDLPDVVQALPTTERIQQYFLPEEKTSPELQAGITGGNIVALGQGIASLPAAAKGIAKGATAGSKSLANEAAYRIYQAVERGEGALAPMLAGVAPRKMIPSGKSVGKTSFEMQHELAQKRAALPVEQGGLGLPPNNSLMDRAKAMGWVNDVYHATTKNFPAFDVGKAGESSKHSSADIPAVWTSKSPKVANIFISKNVADAYPIKNYGPQGGGLKSIKTSQYTEGGNIMPLMLRGKPDAILKAGDARDMILGKSGSDWRDSGDDFRQWFEKNNPEILKIKGHPMTDLEFRADQYVVKDPDNLRSRFAAFDPFRRNAAIAAAMGVAAPDLMAAEPDKKAEGGITSDDLIIEENPL